MECLETFKRTYYEQNFQKNNCFLQKYLIITIFTFFFYS